MALQDVLEMVTQNLEHQGFGVITTIDVQETFKRKLNVGFRAAIITPPVKPNIVSRTLRLIDLKRNTMDAPIAVTIHVNTVAIKAE
jgi:uncharacterized protein (DUF302 family)